MPWEIVLSLLADQNQLVGRYDISVIEKSDCLCNMLIKGSDQNESRVSGGPGGQFYVEINISERIKRKDD